MSTNAVSHLQRMHPEEFDVVREYKKRKQEKLEHTFIPPLPKKAKATISKPRKNRQVEIQETEESGRTDQVVGSVMQSKSKPKKISTPTRQRSTEKTLELMNEWLLSTGLPLSVVKDSTFLKLLKLSPSTALPTATKLTTQVDGEFTKFGRFLAAYLTAESLRAFGMPFLSVRYEFGAIPSGKDEGLSLDKQKFFLGVDIGLIDSQWRRVNLTLAAREVQGWDQQVNQLISHTLKESYGIQDIWSYARFQVASDGKSALHLANNHGDAAPTDDQHDVLTHTLRGCVLNALGLGAAGSSTSGVRRILRLLQKLLEYFAAPTRASALQQIGSTHGLPVPPYSVSMVDDAARTSSSIGAIANLLRTSCIRYQAYCAYFQSSTTLDPELENAWVQLSMDDWQTVTEIEAMLNLLAPFRVEERCAPHQGATASSYSLLFRRLLSVSSNASQLKCLSLDDHTIVASYASKGLPRRKAKRSEAFTAVGRECLTLFRQQVLEHFAAPSTPEVICDEIKAMLLDPRISPKVASLVTDARAFRQAQEALREEHRMIFEELATRDDEANNGDEDNEEDADESDDDEMSALLMVDGPKNQPPSTLNASTSSNRRRSSDALVEEEARAWHEWQQVYVAWDAFADEGADLFDKGQYNLLKLYHHVDILKWFRDVGQQAHPAAALLARIYLGQQLSPTPALGSSLTRFMEQEEADWITNAAERAEKRCILRHNWQQYKQLNGTLPPATPHAIDSSSA
ncbi:hypothetical protein PHYBOEH_003507 [Phytophthora boehmeriae]|uniref:Uncharacterized protein n=1 Tax=Phytophthora boehmeriae TaxID=109152 RepID=A0A8T1XD97_9STRA|nr:hypothetical protein PHYBOEH_003507 [Phytophthora boehmeriae]